MICKTETLLKRLNAGAVATAQLPMEGADRVLIISSTGERIAPKTFHTLLRRRAIAPLSTDLTGAPYEYGVAR